MLKITIALLVVALSGTAAADEPSSLRVDASSHRAFKRSLAAFKEELSLERRQAFGDALSDIWIARTQAAEGEGRKYRAKDYYRQIDGLGYDEVVELTTGEAAKQRKLQRGAVANQRSSRPRETYQWPSSHDPVPPIAREPLGAGGGITLTGPTSPPQW